MLIGSAYLFAQRVILAFQDLIYKPLDSCEEAQAGIKIARRNTNNLRYADDITLMAENKEELKSLLMVKEESEIADNTQHSKTIVASDPITLGQIESGRGDGFYFLGL